MTLREIKLKDGWFGKCSNVVLPDDLSCWNEVPLKEKPNKKLLKNFPFLPSLNR